MQCLWTRSGPNQCNMESCLQVKRLALSLFKNMCQLIQKISFGRKFQKWLHSRQNQWKVMVMSPLTQVTAPMEKIRHGAQWWDIMSSHCHMTRLCEEIRIQRCFICLMRVTRTFSCVAEGSRKTFRSTKVQCVLTHGFLRTKTFLPLAPMLLCVLAAGVLRTQDLSTWTLHPCQVKDVCSFVLPASAWHAWRHHRWAVCSCLLLPHTKHIQTCSRSLWTTLPTL